MAAINSAVVVGGGIAGLTVGALLAQRGVEVDLVEQLPQISALGSGITLQGNALRVLREVGIWDGVLEHGKLYHRLGFRDAATGEHISEVESPKVGGTDLPATAGMYRPTLARLLAENAERSGVRFHFDAAVVAIEQFDGGARVRAEDGREFSADLVIAAGGLHSPLRGILGIQGTPQPLSQGIWRAFVPKPKGIEHTELYWGGPCYYAGYTPTGDDEMYAYLVEEWQDHTAQSDFEKMQTMKELAIQYGGPWAEIAASMDESTPVNYTGIDRLMVPEPWHRGNAVLIGDAVHSCPPTIAQGAAQALEDASVLAELIASKDDLEAVWEEFYARRLPRIAAVVDASVQLSEWQREGASPALGQELTRKTFELLTESP